MLVIRIIQFKRRVKILRHRADVLLVGGIIFVVLLSNWPRFV
jgi:hypothetical protein